MPLTALVPSTLALKLGGTTVYARVLVPPNLYIHTCITIRA